MVGYIYKCIDAGMTGLAAAGSLILFGIILIFTAINSYISNKKVHY
jgi:ABC-type sugar transport system permease subunit